MPPRISSQRYGGLHVVVFDFAQAGDSYPVHQHNVEAALHISIVARGRVAAAGKEHFEGSLIDWKPGEPHGFVALTAGARVFNILKRHVDPSGQA